MLRDPEFLSEIRIGCSSIRDTKIQQVALMVLFEVDFSTRSQHQWWWISLMTWMQLQHQFLPLWTLEQFFDAMRGMQLLYSITFEFVIF